MTPEKQKDGVKYGSPEFQAKAAEALLQAKKPPRLKQGGVGWCNLIVPSLALLVVALSMGARLPKPRNEIPLPDRCHTHLPISRGPVDGRGAEEILDVTFSMDSGEFSKSDGRKYDLILFGATGFTGQNVANYLASRVGPPTSCFSWHNLGSLACNAIHDR